MSDTFAHVENGDVRLRVRLFGDPDRPLLVVLHGWPDSSRGWSHIAPRLTDRFWVVAPDLRGFAGSSKPVGTESYRMSRLIGDVHAIADWANAPDFYLAGHDFGGAVTWAMGMFAPARVRRAVVMAAPHTMVMKRAAGDLRQLAKAAYTLALNAGPRGEALLRAEHFDLLARFAFGGVEAITDADITAYKAEWSQPDAFTAMAEYYRAHYTPDLLNPDVVLDLPPVTVPTRYVHGLRDFAFIDELATGSGDYVEAEYDEVHLDTSHWMLYEEPERVAQLITEWCD